MKKFILYASAFVVFLALVGWLIYPINLVIYASVLGTVTVILLIKTNERREEAITKIVGSSLRRTIFRSVRYTWIAIIGVNVISFVAYPLLTDVNAQVYGESSRPENNNILHVGSANDSKVRWIKDYIDNVENIRENWQLCPPSYSPLSSKSATCPYSLPSLKLYEALSMISTLELTGSNSSPGVDTHYWRFVEYKGNYYTVNIWIPHFYYYFPQSFMISLVGSAAIALAWVRFGQSKNKQRDVVQE